MPIPALLFNPLVLKGIAVIAIVLGVTVWWNVHNYRVRQAAIAEYKVKLQDCADATATAVNANKTLVASTERLAEKIKDQNEKIQALTVQESAARKVKDEALARALAKERSLREEVVKLTAIASGPPAPTKEIACEAADSILKEYAQKRG